MTAILVANGRSGRDGRLDAAMREGMARMLERSGYGVLRPLPAFPPMPADMAGHRRGVIVDVETTGVDPKEDGILQVAIQPFAVDEEDRIVGAGPTISCFLDPFRPIPPAITRLTGIDLTAVQGKNVTDAQMSELVGAPDIVLAHNSSFDRKFLEAQFRAFRTLPWGCTLSQVPWAEEGFDGTKLPHLMMRMGYHLQAHRADQDVLATLAAIARPLPISRVTPIALLMKAARAPLYRAWATGAAFRFKDALRARGYRWSSGGKFKAWFRDVSAEERDAEERFLKTEVFAFPVFAEVPATDRFSDRH